MTSRFGLRNNALFMATVGKYPKYKISLFLRLFDTVKRPIPKRRKNKEILYFEFLPAVAMNTALVRNPKRDVIYKTILIIVY
jgi:hypothetical protein